MQKIAYAAYLNETLEHIHFEISALVAKQLLYEPDDLECKLGTTLGDVPINTHSLNGNSGSE